MPRVRYSKTKGLYSETGSHEGVCLRTNSTVITAAGDHTITTNDGDHNVYVNVELVTGNDITLPQATVNNIGAVVKVHLLVDAAASGTIRVGFLESGSTVMKGGLTIIGTGATMDAGTVLSNAKVILLDDAAASRVGGAGTVLEFHYVAKNLVCFRGVGITQHSTPAYADSTAFSATGIS